MPYDICDDEQTLDLIESEMAGQGITQEMIDDRRQLPEKDMLNDMKLLHQQGIPLDQRMPDESTYVSYELFYILTMAGLYYIRFVFQKFYL